MTKTIHVERLRGRIDFAIITIREDEFEAVLERFSPRYPVLGGDQFYEYCPLEKSDGRIAQVAVVRTPEEGQSVAQSVARDTIDDLEPRWLILAGIAGGIPDGEFSLGDVLLASSLHDFSITAAIQDQQPQFRPAGGRMHPAVEQLLAALPAWRDRLGEWNQEEALGRTKPQVVVPNDICAECYYGADATKETVRDSLQTHFPTSGSVRPPLYKTGAVATANVLLKDAALLEEWRRCARHITHIEMEAGGVYQAARHGRPHQLPLLCVRGISDIVGFKRAPEWTQFACDTAASLLHAIVSIVPLEMFHGQAQTLSPPPDIAQETDLVAETEPKTPTLDAIVRAFEKSSLPLLCRIVDPNERIPRAEQNTLEQFSADGDARVLCVLGSPGSGKTALLALVAQNAIHAGHVTLGIKADILPTEMPFATWGRRAIGLDVTALDAVKAVSSRSRVLVVVDQLDALASTVDLESDPLNAVIEFIDQCSSLPRVSVICSCRTFEYYHDVRFSSLNAKAIELELPKWDDVAVQLAKHGVKDSATWPEPFREVLRTPQHLQVYLNRFAATGKTDPFGSYYLMLDDLWRTILNSAEREFIYQLTEYLLDHEGLWAPLVQFEEHQELIASLESKHILQSEDRRIGFRHQTLLEHAKARLFTIRDKSLSRYVLEQGRQDAIFVRPTVWAVLRYLRDANPEKYRVEIEELFSAELRLHMRYLLIEFLGELPKPQEYEIVLLAERLLTEEDQLRVVIAIRGNAAWFHALRTSHFPVVMRRSAEQQWPMIGVIGGAWDFDREACIRLIEEYWLSDPDKDRLTWSAMGHIRKWDDRTVEIVCTLIRRADPSGDILPWAGHRVSLVSADQPKLAPRVFMETVSRLASVADEDADPVTRRLNSPLESTGSWYDLPAVAEAAPMEFLRAGWQWLVQICEEYHSGYRSTVVYEYSGSCSSLDERPRRRDAPVLTAFCAAIDAVAGTAPKEFVEITKQAWSSENAVVHRLVLGGLCLVAREQPQIALQYLNGDRRRFQVGSYESDQQSDSIELIRAVAPRLTEGERQQLEEMILSWSMYHDGVELSEEQKEWDREARLRLLASIPAHLLSRQNSEFVETEKEALPDWNHETRGVRSRSGFVREVPPMSKEEMLTAPNDEVVRGISASKDPDRSNREWIEVEGGWEEPGGAYAAGRELAELAKKHPQRSVELIKVLLASGNEDAAAAAIHGLSGTSLTDDEVFAFVREVASLNPQSEELRSDIGYLLCHRCRGRVGLPDDLCDLLGTWLSQPWDSTSTVVAPSDSENEEHAPESVESVLWSNRGADADTDQSFWPLLAITNGYLMRSPPETGLWLDAVEKHLYRNIAEGTWAAYCSKLRWIRLQGCDRVRGSTVIAELFARYPALRQRQEGVRLIAHVSDLLSASFVKQFLDSLRASKAFTPRQAFGELLTLIAFRGEKHAWAIERLNSEIAALGDAATLEEPIAVGMAFAAARLWDEPQTRAEASRVLSHLIPNATKRISQAIATVFWAREDFAADEATESLLQAFAAHPGCLSEMPISDLVEHLITLVPHRRMLVLSVCEAILKTGRQESDLFETGPQLVKIAMTLQRFSDTRAKGLSLLEDLLRLGLDDAFRILRDIDIRPAVTPEREPRQRRRRRRP